MTNRLKAVFVVSLLLSLFISATPSLLQDSIPEKPIPTQRAATIRAGSGDVQITLEWDNLDDLDLWVREPNGEVIYFANPGSYTGGQLDVDANAVCYYPDNTPAENIFWPQGEAPLGDYTVYVKHYMSCTESIANWRLTVTDRGRVIINETGTGVYSSSYNYTLAEFTFNRGNNIEVKHIEITQATQTVNNDIPLIADRPTWMRVYVSCVSNCPLRNVRGEISYGSSTANSTNTLTIVNTVSDWTSQRGDQSATINFVIPKDMVATARSQQYMLKLYSGLGASPVYEQFHGFEVNAPNNLKVLYVPIEIKDRVPSSDSEKYYIFAQNALPISNLNQDPIGYVHETDFNHLGTDDTKIALNRELNVRLVWKNATQTDDEKYDYLAGWIASKTRTVTRLESLLGSDTLGWQIGDFPIVVSKDSYENENDMKAMTTFAHELGHAGGVGHINTKGSLNDPNCNYGEEDKDSGWTFSDSKIQEFGSILTIKGLWTVADPSKFYDIMSYCDYTKYWISPFTYRKLNDEFSSLQQLRNTPRVAQDYYVISGLAYTNNTIELDPATVIYTDDPMLIPASGSTYCVETRSASSTIINSHCFDLAFESAETGDSSNVDSFFVMLPKTGSESRFTVSKNGNVLTSYTFSSNAPQVNVIYPNGGEVWQSGQTQKIRWSGSDADNDTLYYTVLYSYDGGAQWSPLAIDVTETSLDVNVADLPGGNALIRVKVSDGANIGTDESNATFTVPPHAPEATITTPKKDTTINADTSFVMEGYGTDKEDGALEATRLVWRSNIDGYLGTGKYVVVELSSGIHTITLTAYDSNGNTSIATRTITASALAVPLVQPTPKLPANNAFVGDTNVTFSWTQVDNAISYRIQVDDSSSFLSPVRDFTVNSLNYSTVLLDEIPYYWRVQGVGPGGEGPWSETLTFTLSVGSTIDILANGDFEGVPLPGKIPADWTGVNNKLVRKDKLKCDKPEINKYVAYSGECAFMFKGNPNGEISKLQQKISEHSVFIDGTVVTLNVYVDTRSAKVGHVIGKLVVKYTDGKGDKAVIRVPDASEYSLVGDAITIDLSNGRSISKVKVQFRNRLKDGKFFIDDASLTVTSSTTSALLQRSLDTVPLPDVPSEFRD